MSELSVRRRADLAAMIADMAEVQDLYSRLCAGIGHPQFLELAGVMSELIKVYRQSLRRGIDFQVDSFGELVVHEENLRKRCSSTTSHRAEAQLHGRSRSS